MNLDELLKIAEAATPGPWHVWKEPTETREIAKRELAALVNETVGEFRGALWMLADAKNVCPALTGCGPTSEANAAFIAAFNPRTAQALVKVALAAEESQKAEGIDEFWDKQKLLRESLANLRAATQQQAEAEGK